MKILITGAHFTPALATLQELKKYRDVEIVYVGRKNTMEGDSSVSLESQILPAMGVKFIPIIAGRLQRFISIYTLLSFLKISVGFIQSFFIILSQKPDVILSFGGYVSVPIIFAGWLFSVPIILHEQTLVLGLANKIGFVFADKIALSFKNKNFKKDNAFFSGNPIRREVVKPPENLSSEFENLFNISKKNKIPVLLFVGGNQGSHILNEVLQHSIEELTKIACVIHITGENKYNDFKNLKNLGDFNGKYLVKKWINEEYGAVLKRVDLVICRAGINTLTELALYKKFALVIPIPYVLGNEQNINAHYFKKIGLVDILYQSKLSKKTLLNLIKLILKKIPVLNFSEKAINEIVNINAGKRLALETILLIKK